MITLVGAAEPPERPRWWLHTTLTRTWPTLSSLPQTPMGAYQTSTDWVWLDTTGKWPSTGFDGR